MLCPRQILEWEEENSILENTWGGRGGNVWGVCEIWPKKQFRSKKKYENLFFFFPLLSFCRFIWGFLQALINSYTENAISCWITVWLLPSWKNCWSSWDRCLFSLVYIFLFCVLSFPSFTVIFCSCGSVSLTPTLNSSDLLLCFTPSLDHVNLLLFCISCQRLTSLLFSVTVNLC